MRPEHLGRWPGRRVAARRHVPAGAGGGARSRRAHRSSLTASVLPRRCAPSWPRRCRPAAGTAVVRSDWPGGQLGHQGPAARRVELGEDVVEQQDRGERRPALGDQLVDRRCAGPGPGTVARPARRGCGPRGPSMAKQELVAVRPDRVDPPPEVVRPVGLERRQQIPLPAAPVGLGDHDPAARPGQAPVGRGHVLLQRGGQALPGGRPGSSRRRPAVGPTRRGWRPRRRSARPPAWRNRAARWRRTLSTSSAARAPSGSTSGQRVVEQLAPAARPAADQGEVLGGEDGARSGVGQVARGRTPSGG